jgi:hypothetical protein
MSEQNTIDVWSETADAFEMEADSLQDYWTITQEAVDAIKSKLAEAREKLGEAQTELDNGNNAAARQKVKEAVALIAEALALIIAAQG